MDPVPCTVRGVFVAGSSGSPVPAVLLDSGDDSVIPIFIGLWEAVSINNALNNEIPPRPLTHDLFVDFLARYHIEMKALTIDSIEDGIFYAKMVLLQDGREELLDCRPSDGIAIAIRCKAGIYLDRSVIRAASVAPADLPDLVGLNSYLYQ